MVFRFKLILPQSFYPLNNYDPVKEAALFTLTEFVNFMKSSMRVQLCMKVWTSTVSF